MVLNMQFIEALKLKSKLLFLFISITVGLVTIAIMGTSYINALKKNIDALYFGSLVPVTELNTIMQTYNNTLSDTLYKASRGEMSMEESLENLQRGLTIVKKNWKSYTTHYKTEEEMQYIDYADLEIEATNNYFQKIILAIEEGKNLKQLSIHTLENKVANIKGVIEKLINYEVQSAKYERKRFLNTYDTMLAQIGTILLLVILGVLAILLYVFRSIQRDHSKLEQTTKKLKIANKKLENVSYTDTLTNLHNRRYFNLMYDRELKRAKRNKTYITFMMLDIDFFKQYNDTYGHLEGDAALKKVAKVLKKRLKRPSDYIFRLGGEEFGVLLSETDETNSARLAREICDAVRSEKIAHKNSSVCDYMTISIGVACCIADDALDENVLLSRADEMLYKAKETGRNRYVITTDVSTAKAYCEENLEEVLSA